MPYFCAATHWPEPFTLALDEHEQARCDLIPVGDEKIASGTGDAPFGELIDQVELPG